MSRARVPTQIDIDEWRMRAASNRDHANRDSENREEYFQLALDHEARINRYQPIVANYERANELRKRIWALGVAIEEAPNCAETLTMRVGLLTLERNELLKMTAAMLNAARAEETP